MTFLYFGEAEDQVSPMRGKCKAVHPLEKINVAFANKCTHQRTEQVCSYCIYYLDKLYMQISRLWILSTFGDQGFCYVTNLVLLRAGFQPSSYK